MTIRERAQAFGWGVLGVLVAVVLFHLWQDHKLVDAIRSDLNAAAASRTAAAAPAQTPPGPEKKSEKP